MFLPLAFTSFLLLTGASAQYTVQLDQFSNDVQDPLLPPPSDDVPAVYYLPPQDLQAIHLRADNGALGTIIYIVELFNKLQHLATAFIQPYSVITKPKPALAPAAAPVVVGGPISQGPAAASAPKLNLSPEQTPVEYVPPRFYPVPSDLYLL